MSGKFRIYIEKDEEIIGKGDNCTIQINGLAIESRHAVIKKKDEQYELKATGKVFMNGNAVDRSFMKNGDIVVFGLTQTHIYLFIDVACVQKTDIPAFEDIQDMLIMNFKGADSDIQKDASRLYKKGFFLAIIILETF